MFQKYLYLRFLSSALPMERNLLSLQDGDLLENSYINDEKTADHL